mmetsp:Transcript_35331/g.104512  ORF Transcript_35331/g.104512 Transcript_35331/m.104512 type:complete len:256 (-) Transcript_35331:1519-2286(-)
MQQMTKIADRHTVTRPHSHSGPTRSSTWCAFFFAMLSARHVNTYKAYTTMKTPSGSSSSAISSTRWRVIAASCLSGVPPLAKPSSAAAMDETVIAMCSHARNVRSFAKNVLGSIFISVVVVSLRGTRPSAFMSQLGSPAAAARRVTGEPKPRTWSGSGMSLSVGSSPSSGCVSSSISGVAFPGLCTRGLGRSVPLGAGSSATGRTAAASWGSGADATIEGRTDSSSTQYGTARTMSGKSVAVPWMNLLNLCTSVR